MEDFYKNRETQNNSLVFLFSIMITCFMFSFAIDKEMEKAFWHFFFGSISFATIISIIRDIRWENQTRKLYTVKIEES